MSGSALGTSLAVIAAIIVVVLILILLSGIRFIPQSVEGNRSRCHGHQKTSGRRGFRASSGHERSEGRRRKVSENLRGLRWPNRRTANPTGLAGLARINCGRHRDWSCCRLGNCIQISLTTRNPFLIFRQKVIPLRSAAARKMTRANPVSMAGRQPVCEGALWSRNANLKMSIYEELQSQRVISGALAFVQLYVWPVLVKVVRSIERRCAPVVLFAAPPLTSTVQTGTWLLRIARRGFVAGIIFRI